MILSKNTYNEEQKILQNSCKTTVELKKEERIRIESQDEEITSKEMKILYRLAYYKLRRKLKKFYFYYDLADGIKPIERMKFRIKSKKSIEAKLTKKGLENTTSNIRNNINDVVGARIVCPFITDVKRVVEDLIKDPEIKIIGYKDYITNPKSNGYSGFHLLIKIPINVNEKIEYVKTEIQIRTIMQDMISSREHEVYKTDVPLQQKTQEELMDIIKTCVSLDNGYEKRYGLAETITEEKKEYITAKENLLKKTEYRRLMKKYRLALGKTLRYIRKLDRDYKKQDEINPIECIKYRIKQPYRIISKVLSRTEDLSTTSIRETISDIAGIRIVCSFKSDLVRIVNDLEKLFYDNNISIKERKDYFTKPKENGYAGYHYIINIPVGENETIPVEIQIRTIAMDMWAIIERNLRSKKMTDEERKNELHYLANSIINEVDDDMERIIVGSRQSRKGHKLSLKKISQK